MEQSSSRASPVIYIYYFQKTLEVTSVQLILSFSLTVSLIIYVQSPWSRLCCIRLFKFVIITLHYIALCHSVKKTVVWFKNLYLLKEYTAQKLLKEFPSRSRNMRSLRRLLKLRHRFSWQTSRKRQTRPWTVWLSCSVRVGLERFALVGTELCSECITILRAGEGQLFIWGRLFQLIQHWNASRAGSGVAGIDLLRFLARCRKRLFSLIKNWVQILCT